MKKTFAESSSRRDQKNIWEFKLLTLDSLKFNQNKLKTLSKSCRRDCVKDVKAKKTKKHNKDNNPLNSIVARHLAEQHLI